MVKLYSWPVCTWEGCTCRHTWASQALATAAAMERDGWVLPDGQAVCWCHGADRATFPCDKAKEAMSYG